MTKLSVIIPCYFNEENIPVTTQALIRNEKNFPAGTKFEYIFVDDGSGDNTVEKLREFQKKCTQKVTIVKLSRNFGANNASLAGLTVSSGDVIAIMAADLQDPPELLPKMFGYWKKGTKVVVANRIGRKDGLLSDLPAGIYHTLMRQFVLPRAPSGGFDLMLFDRQVARDILTMKEKNFFLPYLIMWLGYDYVAIPYVRGKRLIGKSRWTFAKRVKTFIDSFVSFTYLPLRIISISGLLLSVVALAYATAVIIARMRSGIPVEGWTSLVIILLFVSSFQMIALGIIGEYLWRTLDAARGRPPYVIDAVLGRTHGLRKK